MVWGKKTVARIAVGGLVTGVVVLATEREESPGWRPGRRAPGTPLCHGFRGQKSPKNLDFTGFLARSA